VNVPEGKYQVTVTYGDLKDTAITTIKAETRRLIVKDQRTNPGQFATKTFSVIKRNAAIKNAAGVATGTSVGLDNSYGREYPGICLNWDNKLTLEFNGKRACISAVEIQQLPDTFGITVHMCGNSTLVEQEDEPWTAWGQFLPAFFGPNVLTNDLGSSGLTSSSFNSQRRLAKIASMTHKGDYVIFEFGHNDSKTNSGVASVTIPQYRANMKQYMDSATAHGAYMVFVTPTARSTETDSATSISYYADTCRAYATRLIDSVKNAGGILVPKLVDLNAAVIHMHIALGSNYTKLYCYATASAIWPDQPTVSDGTHFSDYGGYQLAKWIALAGFAAGNVPLKKYLVDTAATFSSTAPESPTGWTIPYSIDTIYRHAAATIRPDIKDSAFSTSAIAAKPEAVKVSKQSVGISMISHSISYDVANETGNAEFVIYSISGQKLLERKMLITASTGTMSWNELGRLPVGSYILQMRLNNSECSRISFNKI
jgi:lysophospholipase L1-like esterase